MQDHSRQRDRQMMNAVAGLSGRSALSSEVDLRLGLIPAPMGAFRLPALVTRLLSLRLPALHRARGTMRLGTEG